MKRYTATDRHVMEKDIEGEWVKWEDVENLIEKNKCRDANFFDQLRESQEEYKHG